MTRCCIESHSRSLLEKDRYGKGARDGWSLWMEQKDQRRGGEEGGVFCRAVRVIFLAHGPAFLFLSVCFWTFLTFWTIVHLACISSSLLSWDGKLLWNIYCLQSQQDNNINCALVLKHTHPHPSYPLTRSLSPATWQILKPSSMSAASYRFSISSSCPMSLSTTMYLPARKPLIASRQCVWEVHLKICRDFKFSS